MRKGYELQYGDLDTATGAPGSGSQYPMFVVMERSEAARARRGK
ncbi:MAG: hypothetical protein ABIP94_09465 [Planctomycetota bacterium]